jgi:hypothetical protein
MNLDLTPLKNTLQSLDFALAQNKKELLTLRRVLQSVLTDEAVFESMLS